MTNPAVLVLKLPMKPVLGEQAEDLDSADEEADGDGQRGGGEGVVHRANRVEERPAVRQVHEQSDSGVHDHHAGGEQDRQGQDGVPRDVLGGQQGGGGQQGDLGGGVEAQAERDAHREQLPLLGDDLRPAAEEPIEEPAVLQLPLQLGFVVLAPAHRPEDAREPDQDDQVHQPDQQQERRGRQGAEHPAEPLQR